jgi:ParB-like chromosome segregation protein Spo0J
MKKKQELQIVYKAVDDLIPYARNSRQHSDLQIAQLAGIIKEFGFKNPILVDGDNGIIAGHGRVLAARKLGMTDIPTIECSDLSETQKKAFIIADNKIALNSSWDQDLLKLEIEELKGDGFDLDLLAFDPSEIQFNQVDYSVLEDADDMDAQIDDMAGGVRKAIQIEFEPQDYEEAQELVKYWRDAGAYVGYMIMNFLRAEKEKAE